MDKNCCVLLLSLSCIDLKNEEYYTIAPCAAICCRFDLYEEKPDAHGCTDAKVVFILYPPLSLSVSWSL